MRISDWSSDVCSSDLLRHRQALEQKHHPFWTLLSIGSMPTVETAVAGHEPIEHRFNETLDRPWFLKAHRLGVSTRIIGKHSVRRCASSEEHKSELPSIMPNSYGCICPQKTTISSRLIVNTHLNS